MDADGFDKLLADLAPDVDKLLADLASTDCAEPSDVVTLNPVDPTYELPPQQITVCQEDPSSASPQPTLQDPSSASHQPPPPPYNHTQFNHFDDFKALGIHKDINVNLPPGVYYDEAAECFIHVETPNQRRVQMVSFCHPITPGCLDRLQSAAPVGSKMKKVLLGLSWVRRDKRLMKGRTRGRPKDCLTDEKKAVLESLQNLAANPTSDDQADLRRFRNELKKIFEN